MAEWKKILHTGNVVSGDLAADGTNGGNGQVLGILSNGNLDWVDQTAAGVTSITTNAGLDDTGSTTDLNLSLNLSELTGWSDSHTVAPSDDHLIVLDNGTQKKAKFNQIFGSLAYSSATIPTNTSDLTNDSNFVTSSGVTSVTVEAGLDISGGNQKNIALNLNELTTATSMGTGDFIVFANVNENSQADGQRKILLSNIDISSFNNDSNFSSTTGTVTEVTTGAGLTGTVTGSGQIDLDLVNIGEVDIGASTQTITFKGGLIVDEDVEVTGTLTANGTVTLNSSTVTTTDKVIALASDATNTTGINESGFEIGDTVYGSGGQKPSLLYDVSVGDSSSYGNGWKVKTGHATSLANASEPYYDQWLVGFSTGSGLPNDQTTGKGAMYYDTSGNNMYICVNNETSGGGTGQETD